MHEVMETNLPFTHTTFPGQGLNASMGDTHNLGTSRTCTYFSQVINPRLRSLEARIRLEGMGGHVLAEDGTYRLQDYACAHVNDRLVRVRAA